MFTRAMERSKVASLKKKKIQVRRAQEQTLKHLAHRIAAVTASV